MGKNGREKNLETQNTIISLNENVLTNEWIFPFPLLLVKIFTYYKKFDRTCEVKPNAKNTTPTKRERKCAKKRVNEPKIKMC